MQISDTDVKIAATEFLSHKGENPYRVTRRGAELWEDYAPAMRAALSALSLPVQPVAWRWKRKGAAVWIYDAPLEWLSEQGDAIDKQPLYANPVPPTKGPGELAEIERMLNEGQGDDDGMQIMPDFDEGMSTLAKVETCLHLLEKRRDVIAAYVADENWRDDPSADERWNAGLDFGMSKLCAYLGVDPAAVTWDAATETLDGDVCAVIGNILRAKYGDDWGPLSRIATKGQDDDLIAAREAAAQWRDARSEHGHAKCLRAGTFDQLPEVQSALLALRSRPASALPVVKPLEWNDDCRVFKDGSGERCCDAETVGLTGFYIIWRERDGRHTVSHSHFSVGEGFATLDDAKASAQADYERRILSALTPSVQP